MTPQKPSSTPSPCWNNLHLYINFPSICLPFSGNHNLNLPSLIRPNNLRNFGKSLVIQGMVWSKLLDLITYL